jgi:hypothetical protein
MAHALPVTQLQRRVEQPGGDAATAVPGVDHAHQFDVNQIPEAVQAEEADQPVRLPVGEARGQTALAEGRPLQLQPETVSREDPLLQSGQSVEILRAQVVGRQVSQGRLNGHAPDARCARSVEGEMGDVNPGAAGTRTTAGAGTG